MRLTRSMVRRAALTGAATGLLVGGLLTAAPAHAAVTSDLVGAETVAAQLGGRSAGSYLSGGRLVVTVTDAGAASAVRAAGGVAHLVSRNAAQLTTITTDLARTASIPGTAWAVDPAANQVVVSYDSTVTGARLAQLKAAAGRLGDGVRLESAGGVLSLAISGGQAIYTGGSRCSLGFNVRNSAGTQFFLTAGHCTNIGSTWYGNSARTQVLGTRAGSSFPGNDYGIVRYTSSVARPGNVWLYSGSSTQDITSARTARVGETVRRSGSTTGVRSGTVLSLNATVNYPQGTVTGMIRTNVCAQGGDSGGSLFAGSAALGLTSGGSGNCSSGGITFFQPVTEPMSVFGVNVY